MDLSKFELSTPVKGMDAMDYMSKLIEENEEKAIEVERAKVSIAVLKQMNNRSRLILDACKFEQKQAELGAKPKKEEKDESFFGRYSRSLFSKKKK